MQVRVRLHDILKDRVKNVSGDSSGIIRKELPEEASVKTLLTLLDFDSEVVGLVTVNGRQAKLDSRLKDGDSLELFSPMSGG
jgi:sulfur carrier protein ThiS